jgi:hypothetical protein
MANGLAVTGAISATGNITVGAGQVTTKLELGNQAGSYYGFIFQDASTTGKIRYNSYAASGSSHGHQFETNAVARAVINDTGLAVTGTLSATGTLSGGTSGTGYSFSGSAPAGSLTLDTSGNLLVGTTTNFSTRLVSLATNNAFAAINTTAASATAFIWNQATSGNNVFLEFETEGTLTPRGSITYNRAGGLVAYNTTSDYRAKDISGPVTGSGALIDSTPVYMGKMKGATQERPMFIAHEVPAYAHTGEKDAVDADGNPVYQQMDASALIPVMWAEIQSLRKRITALEAK